MKNKGPAMPEKGQERSSLPSSSEAPVVNGWPVVAPAADRGCLCKKERKLEYLNVDNCSINLNPEK